MIETCTVFTSRSELLGIVNTTAYTIHLYNSLGWEINQTLHQYGGTVLYCKRDTKMKNYDSICLIEKKVFSVLKLYKEDFYLLRTNGSIKDKRVFKPSMYTLNLVVVFPILILVFCMFYVSPELHSKILSVGISLFTSLYFIYRMFANKAKAKKRLMNYQKIISDLAEHSKVLVNE